MDINECIMAVEGQQYESPTREDHQRSISRRHGRDTTVSGVYSHLFDLRRHPEEIHHEVLRQSDANLFTEIPTGFTPKQKGRPANTAAGRIDHAGTKSQIAWADKPKERVAPKKLKLSWDHTGAKNDNSAAQSHYGFVNQPSKGGETPGIYRAPEGEDNRRRSVQERKEAHVAQFLENKAPQSLHVTPDFTPKNQQVAQDFIPTCCLLPVGEKTEIKDHRRNGRKYFR